MNQNFQIMKAYIHPQTEVVCIDSDITILAGSSKCAYTYYNRNQANEIRNLSAHIYSSLSTRQKTCLMALMSNFALQAGKNDNDVLKAFEFYIISIGITEEEVSNPNRPFNTLDEMIACFKTIGDRFIYEQFIIAASGFVMKANNDIGWGLFEEVCESIGYSEVQVQDLLLKNKALVNHVFG